MYLLRDHLPGTFLESPSVRQIAAQKSEIAVIKSKIKVKVPVVSVREVDFS
jgi:hypothetical protein